MRDFLDRNSYIKRKRHLAFWMKTHKLKAKRQIYIINKSTSSKIFFKLVIADLVLVLNQTTKPGFKSETLNKDI